MNALQQQPVAEQRSATSAAKRRHGTGCADQTCRRVWARLSETEGSNLSAILLAADLLHPCFTRPGLPSPDVPFWDVPLWPLNLNERTKLPVLRWRPQRRRLVLLYSCD